MTASLSAHGVPLASGAGVIAPLSRSEKDPEAGAARRRKIAKAVAQMGLGIGVMFMAKAAVTAAAVWASAPALLALYLTATAAAVTAGSLDYMKQKKAAEAEGREAPSLFSVINNSKSAKMAFGFTALGGAAFAFLADLVDVFYPSAPSVSAAPSVPEAAGTIDYSAAAPEPAALEPATPAADVASAVQDAVTSHDVRPGDTLWGIAQHYAGEGATPGQIAEKMHDIAAFNQIENVNAIQAGQTLKLPVTAEDFERVAQLREQMAATARAAAQASAQAAVEAQATVAVPDYSGLPPVSDVTDENGVRTIVHASGIVETHTPGVPVADAVQLPAAPAAAPVAVPVVDAPAPAVMECTISETDSAVNVSCTEPRSDVIKPGEGIDFRVAGQAGEAFRSALSPDSPAMKTEDFLAEFAVNDALEAYQSGHMKLKP